MIPPVVASDRGRAQTGLVAMHGRGCRTGTIIININGNYLERQGIEGDTPVPESIYNIAGILSRAGHVKSCLNPRGPSRKAKYS